MDALERDALDALTMLALGRPSPQAISSGSTQANPSAFRPPLQSRDRVPPTPVRRTTNAGPESRDRHAAREDNPEDPAPPNRLSHEAPLSLRTLLRSLLLTTIFKAVSRDITIPCWCSDVLTSQTQAAAMIWAC